MKTPEQWLAHANQQPPRTQPAGTLNWIADIQADARASAVSELTEALRKAILLAESASMRVADSRELNWHYLNESKAVYDRYRKEAK